MSSINPKNFWEKINFEISEFIFGLTISHFVSDSDKSIFSILYSGIYFSEESKQNKYSLYIINEGLNFFDLN